MLSRRRLVLAAVGAAALGSAGLAQGPDTQAIPQTMPGTLNVPPPQHLAPPPAVPAQPAPQPIPQPVPECEPCPPECPPVVGRCPPPPPCGPRIRLHIPAPQIIFRTTRERRVVEAAPCPVEEAPCAPCRPAPSRPSQNFGAAPQQPSTTTVHVPYTYWVPVPTYGVVPQTNFGAVSTGFGASAGFGGVSAGFGAAPAGFGAVSAGFGAAPAGFGAVQAAAVGPGFGAAGTNLSEAAIRAGVAAALKAQSREGGFGSAPGGADDVCRKEVAELAARVDKLRSDFDEFRKVTADTQGKLAEAVGRSQAEQKQIVEALDVITQSLDKLTKAVGTGDGKRSLTETIKELDDKLEKLKKDVKPDNK